MTFLHRPGEVLSLEFIVYDAEEKVWQSSLLRPIPNSPLEELRSVLIPQGVEVGMGELCKDMELTSIL